MSCEEMTRLIARRADGTLSASDGDRLDAHLTHCVSCRAELEVQQVVARLLSERPEAPLPFGFAERLSGRLRSPGWLDLVDWRAWTYRVAPAAAGLALFAMVTAGPAAQTSFNGASVMLESLAVDHGGGSLPASALFWQPEVSGETLLEVVLRMEPDGPLGDAGDER